MGWLARNVIETAQEHRCRGPCGKRVESLREQGMLAYTLPLKLKKGEYM